MVITGGRDIGRWGACGEPVDVGSGFRAELVGASGGELLVLHGYGDLDVAVRDEAHAAIAGVLHRRGDHTSGRGAAPAALVIDLSRATYLAAAVVAALINEAERTRSPRRARLVVRKPGMPARVVELLDLNGIFDVYDDLGEALASPTHGP